MRKFHFHHYEKSQKIIHIVLAIDDKVKKSITDHPQFWDYLSFAVDRIRKFHFCHYKNGIFPIELIGRNLERRVPRELVRKPEYPEILKPKHLNLDLNKNVPRYRNTNYTFKLENTRLLLLSCYVLLLQFVQHKPGTGVKCFELTLTCWMTDLGASHNTSDL